MNTKSMAMVLLAALPLLVHAQEPAGELALVTGVVTATGPGGSRTVGKGDAVYVGETLLVGVNSYASLKFPDGGRVLLRPNTDFTVEAYRYGGPPADAAAPLAPAKPAPVAGQQAFFRLLRGSFRAISGAIGRDDRQDYRVTTPVATIGIRGTDYEVQICAEDCPPAPTRAQTEGIEVAAATLAGLELAQQGVIGTEPLENRGVLLATNEGTVALKTSKGEYLVKVGEVALATSNGQVFMLPVVPDSMLQYSHESPADCE